MVLLYKTRIVWLQADHLPEKCEGPESAGAAAGEGDKDKLLQYSCTPRGCWGKVSVLLGAQMAAGEETDLIREARECLSQGA